jgi:hypothetical protein
MTSHVRNEKVQALGAPAVMQKDPAPPRFQFSSSNPDPLDFRSTRPAVLADETSFQPASPMSEDAGPTNRVAIPRCPDLGWGVCTVASCVGLMQVVWSIILAEAYHASSPLSQASPSSKASHGRVFGPSFLQCCNAQLDQASSRVAFWSKQQCVHIAYICVIELVTAAVMRLQRWSIALRTRYSCKAYDTPCRYGTH